MFQVQLANLSKLELMFGFTLNMIYIISITLSLLAGFICGALFYRKNGAKVAQIEAKAKDAYDTIKK